MKRIAVAFIAAGLAAAWMPALAGDITGTITLKGTPPKERDITPLKNDATCGKFYTEMPTTHFYDVGANGSLADVVVYLLDQSGNPITGKSTGASATPVVLDQKGCLYSPQIFAVQTGQKIMVKNSDPVLHNVHDTPDANSGNAEMNQAQMPGSAELPFTFAKPEMFLRFKCDVHPWMFAWASVFDHPYFAVSEKDGSYKISNVPPGKYKIAAAHRKAGTSTQDVEVKEGAAKVDFTLDVK